MSRRVMASKSASLKPREVSAAVPMRTAPGLRAFESPWMVFLLSVMPTASHAYCILLPVMPCGLRRGGWARAKVPTGGRLNAPQVPEDQVVVGAAGGEHVALGHQGVGGRLGIGDHLPNVVPEGGAVHLLELGGQSPDGVVVRPTLHHGEDGKVQVVHEFGSPEDDAGSGAPQGFVRGARDHVAVLKGGGERLGGDEARDMRHVAHELGPHRVGNLPKQGVVQVARVGARAAHLRRAGRRRAAASAGLGEGAPAAGA